MEFCQSWDLGRMANLSSWKILANYKLSTKKQSNVSEGYGVLICATFASNFAQSVISLALTKLLVIIDVFIQNKILLLYRFLSFDYIQKCKKSTFLSRLSNMLNCSIINPQEFAHTLKFSLRKLWVFGLSTKSPLFYLLIMQLIYNKAWYSRISKILNNTLTFEMDTVENKFYSNI